MTVSIIIAVKTWQKNLEECVGKCLELEYPDFQILILPDDSIAPQEDKRIKIIPTGAVNPAQKRDIALNHASGDILAFIDDDAYPEKDWLANAVINFNDPDVAAVGGPAVTPVSDNLRQKASGLIYQSLLVSGNFAYRYLAKKKIQVDDYPSCNFLVRKSVMQELGGFNTNFWPGEDTKLCLDITQKLKKKIIYDPRVLVHHHRRQALLAHLKQIASYALHRGYFVKRFPETSFKASYFIPSVFVLALVLGAILSLFSPFLRTLYLFVMSFYLSLVLVFTAASALKESVLGPKFRQKSLLIMLVFTGIILTHVAYGVYFLKGLMSQRLREEKE